MKSAQILLILAIAVAALACSQDKPAAPTGTLTGTIRLNSDLSAQVDPQAVLYIIARKEIGPPVAVKKLPSPKFPVSYSLSQADAMLPGTLFQGEIRLSARLDKDGNAGPLEAGDMTGARSQTIPVGSANADIEIDTVIP